LGAWKFEVLVKIRHRYDGKDYYVIILRSLTFPNDEIFVAKHQVMKADLKIIMNWKR